MGRHCKVECRECGKHLRMRHTCETCGKSIRSDNIPRHKRTCQKNKENEGDAVGVSDSRVTETRPKKRKADCLQEAEFEEAEFSGVKPLSEETLLRMMEMMKMTYENRARILKLEKRFYQRTGIGYMVGDNLIPECSTGIILE